MIVFTVAKHFEYGFTLLFGADWDSGDAAESYLFLLAALQLRKHPDRCAVGHYHVKSFHSSPTSVQFAEFCAESSGSLPNLFFIFWKPLHYVLLMQPVVYKINFLKVLWNELVTRQGFWNQFWNLIALWVLNFVLLVLAEHVIDPEWRLAQTFAQACACHHSSEVWWTFHNNSVKLATHNLFQLSHIFIFEQLP